MPATGGSADFLALIAEASQRSVSLQLSNRATAMRLRHRLHNFRKKLMKEPQSPLGLVAESVETKLTVHPDGTATLVVQPRDLEFREAIRSAGVNVDEPTGVIQDHEEVPSQPLRPQPSTPKAIADYLKPQQNGEES